MRISSPHGFYELNEFPGCNQIVVSNHAFIQPAHRGQGYGRAQHEERLNRAANLGYDLILCTVRADNKAEKHILTTHGWCCHKIFTSSETGHLVELWSKSL
jgi:GNAT superfamily N-acetyltransferase